MSKLAWSANDVANTASHSYRVEQVGDSISVVYSAKSDGMAYRSMPLGSTQEAKAWAQIYDNKYGVNHE